MISIKKQSSVDGLESWQTDLHGLTTHTKLERLSNGNIRQTVTNPDGTKVVTNSNSGKVITVQQINSDGMNGNLITYNYDEFNRQTGTVETFGTATVNTYSATYDNNGNILTQTVNGQTTSFEYDVMGRQTKVTAPGGVVTNTTYYSTGEVRRVDGATYPVEYTYNGLGKQATMTTFKDANTPQVTSWTYNARGELVKKTYADGNSVNYTYNADGQLLTRTWARGIVTTYTYDNAGRATGYNYSDGVTPAVVITLDFLDRPSSVADAAGTRNFTYSSDHLQTGETIPYISEALTYGYDSAKRKNALTLGYFYSVNYTYDAKGRPASIAFNGKAKNYSYVPGTSNLSGYNVVESGNSIMSASYSYDAHKRLTGITASVNGLTYTHGYTLNDKNQRTGIILADGKNWNFSYDNMGQVTGAILNNSGSLLNTYSYNYDLIGNRILAAKDDDISSYTSNIVNQYTQINSAVPTYDQDGNMLTNGSWSYTWNGENRMTVAQNAARKVEFSYDYAGRCFERKEYTAFSNDSWNLDKTVYIVYDDYKQIAEYVNEELHQQYAWDIAGLDTVAFMSKSNSVYVYWTDGNKNVLKLFNTAGEQASYSYDPFGKVTTAEGSLAAENPFRFSSEYHNDITGLVEYIYRKYDPAIGRWINRDPAEEQGGVNLYSISLNDSINNFDSRGHYTIESAAYKKFREKNTLKVVPFTTMTNFDVWFMSLTEQEKFDIWISVESLDVSWVEALPKCPERVCKVGDNYFIDKQENVDVSQWLQPTAAGLFTHKYHTSYAKVELRSKSICGHSNQCIYVKSNIKNKFVVSREMPVAGTADYKAPGNKIGEVLSNITRLGDGHQMHDVFPFDLAVKLDKRSNSMMNVRAYYSVRPIW